MSGITVVYYIHKEMLNMICLADDDIDIVLALFHSKNKATRNYVPV